MKTRIIITAALVTSLFFTGCSKDKDDGPVMPTVENAYNEPVQLSATSAKLHGIVTSDGNTIVTERGVCWSLTDEEPTTDDSKAIEGNTGRGNFITEITGLEKSTKYYARVYATNKIGTAYGKTVTFTTLTLATLSTTPASGITSTTVRTGGDITDNGGEDIVMYGVCWSESASPTTSDSKSLVNGNISGSYVRDITELKPGTEYYLRAFAVTKAGTAYGDEITFTTQP